MSEFTRILFAEDRETDYELACREIRRVLPNAQFERVESREAFLAAIRSFQPELIISDYRMPSFDGLTALTLALHHAPATPVIIVTTASNEDTAVECMKAGAADYVIKEHSKRLGQAVVRALEEKAERAARRMAEQALDESDERLRQLAENIDSAMFVLDLEPERPRISYLSPACERVFDRTRAELCDAPLSWLDSVVDDDRSMVRLGVSALLCGREREAEFSYRAVNADGRVRHVRVKAKVIDANAGRRLVALAEDVTKQAESEIANGRLQAQLAQAHKMETVGRLAGGIAHDFNNLICVMLGYAQLMQGKLSPDDSLRNDVNEIIRAAERARDMTSQLLAFSRKQMISPRLIDLNAHISETRRTLRRLIREDIELRFEPGDALWTVRLDPSQLDQVLVNLAVNARDAMTGPGVLTLSTRNVTYTAGLGVAAGRASGDYVVLRISDTGQGMNKEVLEHLFEPFFTTKEAGKGTGLGLATVYGILQQNGGFIDVESRPGAGSSFQIYFPRSEQAAAPAPVQDSETLQRGTGRILLVEDDRQVRLMATAMLETLGYTVRAADTPQRALELCVGAETPFDLLVSDIVMPGMNGLELHQRVRSHQRSLQALFMSGYAPEAMLNNRAALDNAHFIRKPFEMAALASAVWKALHSAAEAASGAGERR